MGEKLLASSQVPDEDANENSGMVALDTEGSVKNELFAPGAFASLASRASTSTGAWGCLGKPKGCTPKGVEIDAKW